MNVVDRIRRAEADPSMIAAAVALTSGRLDLAERQLRPHLKADPLDVVAIRMLAEVAGRLGRYADAERLLARALALAPDFHAARANYVTVLHRQSKFSSALVEAERLVAAEPHDHGHLALLAGVLVRIGEYERALETYRTILARHPDQVRLWVSYGHVLKTIGRQAESVAAYRAAIQRAPEFGDAWWSLANLKTVRFDDVDVDAMQAALGVAAGAADRYHLHFALGKALEDREAWAQSFEHYAAGNRLRRAELPYDPDRVTRHVAQFKALVSASLLDSGPASGHPARDPIFVVGLPRAGSTLVEQILASHSEVEGTMELPDIAAIAADLGMAGTRRGRSSEAGADAELDGGYLRRLQELSAAERHALGQRYLDATRVQRKSARPRFVDKMPNNWAHVALIHLILPNAVIIDARRDPVATCVSCFRQHFSRGQGFTYDLRELGRYWRDYAELMAHVDRVRPGRVYRLEHEALVAEPEREIRALLAHCGLPFEAACLRPHENPRPVRTASSEQVRRPIGSERSGHWRRFEPWLGPLYEGLGDALRR